MKNLFNRERIIALVCIAFAGYIWFEAGTYPASALDSVGPSKYPRLLAVLIAIASLALFAFSKGPVKPIKGKMEFIPLCYVLVCIMCYLALFTRVGFIIATALFLLSLTLYFDKREMKARLRVAIPYAVIFSIALYFFFAKLLGVLLPSIIL